MVTIPTVKEEQAITTARAKIRVLYNLTTNPEIKRRCALALTALNLKIHLDPTTEEEPPF